MSYTPRHRAPPSLSKGVQARVEAEHSVCFASAERQLSSSGAVFSQFGQFKNKYLCWVPLGKACVISFHFLPFFLSARDQSVKDNLEHFIFKLSECDQNVH